MKSTVNKQLVIGLFVDIKGAFDNVLVDKVTQAMKAKGVPERMTRWYEFFLKNRTIESTILEHKALRKISRGLPQGTVISPYAWNLIMDSLLELVNDGIGLGVAFADDLVCLIAGHDLGSLVICMQRKVNSAIK